GPHDRPRPTVDHPVPDRPCLLVPVIGGLDHGAAHVGSQPFQGRSCFGDRIPRTRRCHARSTSLCRRGSRLPPGGHLREGTWTVLSTLPRPPGPINGGTSARIRTGEIMRDGTWRAPLGAARPACPCVTL